VPIGACNISIEKEMKKYSQIIFFPFLRFKTNFDLSFDRLNLENLEEFLSCRLTADSERSYIKRLLASNKIMGETNNEIKIIYNKKNEQLEPADDNTIRLIEEYKILLFISSVSACNINITKYSGHFIATSDSFSVVYQNFDFESEWTGFTAGGIIRNNSVGYKIDELIFEKPPFVRVNELSFDIDLFKCLKRSRKISTTFYRRITRSIESLMQGYHNSDDISNDVKILSIVRAFEILFDLPEREPRKYFKDKIEKYCQLVNERKYKYKFKVIKSLKESQGSIHQIWADRFYILRNHIIHGNSIKSNEYVFRGVSHINIAVQFYIVALKNLLNELFDKKYFYDVIRYKNNNFSVDIQIAEQLKDKMKECYKYASK